MFSMTRKRWVGSSSALTIALVLVLMLTSMASAAGPVVHRVSVGGPDACVAFGYTHPGCDANFSLVAMERDGVSSGQYTDRYSNGDGFHAVIDCLSVVGNQAWVSGTITHGRSTDPDTGEVTDLAGMAVSTSVVDNGTNANSTPDQISFSHYGYDPDGVPYAFVCTDQPAVGLFDAPQGQVKVN